MSDFFREVDEELRRDQMKQLWDRYGLWLIIAALVITLGTAGFRGWQWYSERQAQQAGQVFYDAVLHAREDPAAALLPLQNLASGRTGYSDLARLRLGGAQAESGDIDAALATFETLAEDRGADELLRDIARIRAGYLMIDRSDLAAMQASIEDLARDGEPFRHSAREILGLTAFRTGEYSQAAGYFDTLMADPALPADLRRRGDTLQALLAGRLPASSQSETAGDSEATQ
ncbi:MAG: tetratricopeptide repeat protein [Pseudomonadota bacterium]